MPETPSWLLLVHHLPPRPTRLRVRVWRHLQRLGAAAVKSSVYVLPWSDKSLEDFTWLRQEIEAGGGEAVLFRAAAVAGATDDEIVAAFRQDRAAAYTRLTSDLDRLSGRMSRSHRGALRAPAELDAFETEVETMQKDMTRIQERDFFEAPGRAKAMAALARSQRLLRSTQGRKAAPAAASGAKSPVLDAARYQGRLWVTRPRPHVDRCASAWLIRRFIDRRPRFAFVAEGGNLRRGIPYDMSEVELGHHGEDCTFETLMKRFGLAGDAAVRGIAEIVHDIDLKDDKYRRPEAAGVNAVLRGLTERTRDDRQLLREAGALFDGLHATLAAGATKGRRHAPTRRR